MQVTVGTFNLNNLFSRFDFRGELADGDAPAPPGVPVTFTDPATYVVRTYHGSDVRGKPAAELDLLATRIDRMALDVLAVQEVEDIETLRSFNREQLKGRYEYVVLVEGNDERLIDVGVLSKLPIGAVTSWRHTPDPAAATPDHPVFSRDLLQVEIRDTWKRAPLCTLFVNHLKSHYVPPPLDPATQTPLDNALRQRQADAVARIVASQMRIEDSWIVLGDMNDPPSSPYLAPFTKPSALSLVDGLADAVETHPAPPDEHPPASPVWTHRFEAEGHLPVYELLDQIWLSPRLADRKINAQIDRRTNMLGDGSDHDPAWVTLDL